MKKVNGKILLMGSLTLMFPTILALSIQAQTRPKTLPPIPGPVIEKIAANAKWQINVTNAGTGQPIEVHARLYQSAHAYGSGLMKLRNVSNKNVLAFRGEWVVKSAQGAMLKDGWKFGNAIGVFWHEAAVTPGKEVELPIGGPVAEIFGAPDRIQAITVRVTGVVFSDKSHWGEDGYNRYESILQDAKSWAVLFERVKEFCRNQRPEAVAGELIKPAPGIFFDAKHKAFFKWLLLDKQNQLRPDGMQKLDSMSESLKAFCT